MATTQTRSATMPVDASGPACMAPPAGERHQDFSDTINVSQVPPTSEELDRVADYIVQDSEGKEHTFKSLFDTHDHDRVLILLVRHFFCGNCQEFLHTLLPTITPLPERTTLIVIGHGSPDLIPFYASTTGCNYPMYADPSKDLYAALGMARTLSLGPEKPGYMEKHSMAHIMLRSLLLNVGQGRKMLKGGDYWQVGGEMVLERSKSDKSRWECNWIHRMENTRDHAEVDEISAALRGLSDKKDGAGIAVAEVAERSRSKRARENSQGTAKSDSDDENKEKARDRPGLKKRWSHAAGGVRRSLGINRAGWARSRSRDEARAGTSSGNAVAVA